MAAIPPPTNIVVRAPRRVPSTPLGTPMLIYVNAPMAL